MSGKILWQPQPRQRAFMSRPEWEALYGGAAGGGKSDALVAEALRQADIPHYKGLILRKTFPQLSELIDKTQALYPRAFPGAKYNSSSHVWTFPSGAKILFGDMQYASDRTKYQGQSYDYIAFDELTHFTWQEYSYLFSRCRPNGPGTRCYIRATANPGGIGHGWVKARFVTPAPPMTPILEQASWIGADGTVQTGTRSRIFVPATVYDNEALLENDPGYVMTLSLLPEAEKQALLYGSWDSFTGQVFTEWRSDPAHSRDGLYTHVIDPFPIPRHWRVWCSMDWGYSRPFSVGWYAVTPQRRLIRIRELYGCTDSPNTGVRWEPTRLAKEILRIEQEDDNLRGRPILRVADPAVWGSDGTESIGALMERERVYFERGDNNRRAGKMQVHHRLAFDGDGRPGLYVFSTCRGLIRTLPALVYDTVDVEDVDTAGEDHIYDELRYVCMKNPLPAPDALPETRKGFDPLELP